MFKTILLFSLFLFSCAQVMAQKSFLAIYYEKNYAIAGQDLTFYIQLINAPEGKITYKKDNLELPQSDGYGIYKFRAGYKETDATAQRKDIFTATLNQNGKLTVWSDTLTYFIRKAQVTLAPISNSVLYLNCKNKISVNYPEFREDYVNQNVFSKQGQIERGKEKDVFFVVPEKPLVSLEFKQAGTPVNSIEFKAVALPEPLFTFDLSGQGVQVKASYPASFQTLCSSDTTIQSVSGMLYLYHENKSIQSKPFSAKPGEWVDYLSAFPERKSNDHFRLEVTKYTRLNFAQQPVVEKLAFPYRIQWAYSE